MGKTRVIAETGAGQHGVATATACALLGLECVVYMGTEDMRRQAPNVERMHLLGAEVAAGRGRRAHAQGGGQRRDPRLGRRTSRRTHYVIGSAVGPAPYPALVRDLQRVIGDEAREQALARRGRAAAARDRVRRRRLERDRDLLRLPRRRRRRADRRRGRRGRGSTAATTAPRWSPGARRSSTARCRRCSPTRRARSSRRTRSRPGSTIPGSGPSMPSFATPAAPATRPSPTSRRSRRSRAGAARGDPARARARPRDRVAARRQPATRPPPDAKRRRRRL